MMLFPVRGTFTLLFLLRVAASTRAATWLDAGLIMGSVRTPAAEVEVIWKPQLPGDETAMSIALDEAGRFYTATSKRRVLCFSASGELAWQALTPADIQTAPVIDNDGRVFVAYNGGFPSLEHTTLPLGHAIAVPTPPLLTPDGLLAFTSGNRVLVLQTTLAPAPSGWPMHRANPARDGRASLELSIANFQATPAGGWELSVRGAQGTTCLVEESADLTTWSTVARVSIQIPNLTIPLPSHPGPGPRFYRVKTE